MKEDDTTVGKREEKKGRHGRSQRREGRGLMKYKVGGM